MSTFAYATVNQCTGLTAGAFSVSTGAGPSGAAELYLCDGRMDTVYPFTAGTTAETLQIDLGSAKAVCGWAILNHNIAALGGGTMTITASTDSVSWVTIKNASTFATTAPRNKDSVFQFTSTSLYRYWRLAFTHSLSLALKVGEVFAIAASTQLSRGMLDGSGESEEFLSVGVDMLYGETRSVLFGGPVRTKRLRFQDFSAANLLELQTMWRATSGATLPFIWIDSYEATSSAAAATEQECVFGRLMLNDFSWTYTDFLYRQPPEFAIRSLGREAGA